MFDVIFLLPVEFLISFGTYLPPKLPKYLKLSPLPCKATESVPTDLYSSRLITYAPSFISCKHFLNKSL